MYGKPNTCSIFALIPDFGRNDKNERNEEKAISDFLNQQKLRNQQLFVRRYYAADSLETLAEEFDMSENSIAAVLLRMRKKLAAYLDDNGFDTAR